jgi:competence protein ComER
MRIGVIGTGNIGGMLARGFAADPAAKVYLYNRTPDKAEAVARDFSNVHALDSLRDIVWFSEVIFLCTKARDGADVLRKIGGLMASGQILATTISSIPLATLQDVTHAKTVKVIPSITQMVQSGSILICGADTLDAAARGKLERILAPLGRVHHVQEADLRVASDLASCGPAFLASLLTAWAKVAAQRSGLSECDCLSLVQSSAIGLAALLESGLTVTDVIQRVAVPGGVTEAGLTVLGERAPSLFEQLHLATSRHALAAETPAQEV